MYTVIYLLKQVPSIFLYQIVMISVSICIQCHSNPHFTVEQSYILQKRTLQEKVIDYFSKF